MKNIETESASFSSITGYTQKQKFEYFLTFRKRLSRLFILQALEFMEEVINPSMMEFTSSERIKEVYRTVMRFYKRAFYPERAEETPQRDSKRSSRNKKLDEKFIKLEINSVVYLLKYIDEFIKLHLNKRWVISKLDSVLKAGFRAAICEAMLIKKPYSFDSSNEENFKKGTFGSKEALEKAFNHKKENDFFKQYFSGFSFCRNSFPPPTEVITFCKEINISYTGEKLISRYKLILSEYTTLIRASVEVKKEVDFFNAVLRKCLIDIKKIRDKKEDFFALILENKIKESREEVKINKAV